MATTPNDDPGLELLPGTLDLLILKTLSSAPLHGYAIVRRLEERRRRAAGA